MSAPVWLGNGVGFIGCYVMGVGWMDGIGWGSGDFYCRYNGLIGQATEYKQDKMEEETGCL